ncbi:MAG TPA: primosomal protein N', partial [Polyangiaceae bacterium]|nr:primosomal protein N' [Polyangiaceae bacterium]
MLLARVALPVPLGQAFTYSVDAALGDSVRRGARVLCELGKRRAVGVVLDVSERPSDVPEGKLKSILAVVDAEPALSEELLGFLQELARYYVAPIGDVMELALPAIERSAAAPLLEPAPGRTASLFGDAPAPSARVVGKLVQVVGAISGATGDVPRGQAQEILEQLRADGPRELRTLTERWPNARAAVAKLDKAGLVEITRRDETVDPFSVETPPDSPPVLNPG